MFSWTTVAISLLAIIQLVVAIPTWEGHASRSAMGSLVPGATEIVALGPHRNKRSPMNNYLSVGGALGEFDQSFDAYVCTHEACRRTRERGDHTELSSSILHQSESIIPIHQRLLHPSCACSKLINHSRCAPATSDRK